MSDIVRVAPGDGTSCLAVLHHGPDHRSTTRCHVTGVHPVHEATYLSYAVIGQKLTARWVNDVVYTDAFDMPPEDPT